jgi:tetratricopeptide (TPR) repeat protein
MNEIKTLSSKKTGQTVAKKNRPFWLPASNYYILAVAASIAFFFLVWGILHEGDEEMPWIPAGFGASVVLGSAVFLREVVLRKAQNRYLHAQRQLDFNLNKVPLQNNANKENNANKVENKFTIEKNAQIIKNIRQKSEAARLLEKLPDAHWEVFEICNEYLSINRRELETIGIGSPRLPALIRGKETVAQIHKFHLLAWAQIESRQLTQEAKNQVKFSEKLKDAQKALSVLESALRFYPNEIQLIESEEAIKEFVASIKISHSIERAERAKFKENYKRAVSFYRDALFLLARENIKSAERDSLAEEINSEIEKIRRLENSTKGKYNNLEGKREIKNKND